MPKVDPPPAKKDASKHFLELMEREGLVIKAVPHLMPRDDGTFSLVARVLVDWKKE